MKHIGIIAEYNPFHNGHSYQINEIKKIFPDKDIIICMSGDYVQRGEPAVFPKALRTKCALSGGADLVIELPENFASASSEHFAAAGVITLASTGIIDTLCFGAECDDINKLIKLSEFFISEPDNYKHHLRNNLSNGLSYPKARAAAIHTCFPNDDFDELLRHPNNILAIDYIKAIIRYDLPIKPYIIKRTSDNHGLLDTDGNLCSSSALRHAMQEYGNNIHNLSCEITSECNNNENLNIKDNSTDINNILKRNIPENIYNIIKESPYGKPIFFEDFYPYLQYRLMTDNNMLTGYHEITEELSNRINNINILPDTFHEFTDILSGKQITHARIRRAMLNVILSRTKDNMKSSDIRNMINYIRILGVRKQSTHLIKEMGAAASLPIINKTTKALSNLPADASSQFEKSIADSIIYRQVFYNKYGIIIPTDYEQSVIIQ